MTKDEFRKTHLDCIHKIHMAELELEIAFWSGKAYDNIDEAAGIVISGSDAVYSRATISVCVWKARNQLQKGM